FLQIQPQKNTIGIEEIRRLKDFLAKKTTGNNRIRRVALISNAHTMSSEAQNALLKNLEEPPEDTMILITTNDLTALKPTIRSRSQHLIILPVSQESAQSFFQKQGHDSATIQNAYFLSGGQV